MAGIKRFEDIKSWQKGRELCALVYTVTGKAAFSRDFGLRDQMRRASVSAMSNIAEGFESQSNRTFIRYLYIAKGSCGEVRAQSYIALDLGCITQDEFAGIHDRAIDSARLISGLITYLSKHLER